MLQVEVSIAIVSYNTKEKLRKCLLAIEAYHEVVVVDNASTDGSPEMVGEEFPEVVLIRNSGNAGFGPANNQAADAATKPLVLYLNSDAYAQPGAIDRLASVFADESIVAAGGRLLNPDLSLQNSTAGELNLWAVFCEQLYLEKLLPGSHLFSPYWNTRRLSSEPCPAETTQLMGACLMVRRGLECFDERFFMYGEDTDLCRRLSRHGRLVYVKDASFIHDLGSSSAGDPVRAVARYNAGKELYFEIHHGSFTSAVCLLLDRVGAFMRWTYWSLRGLGSATSRGMASGFWRVLSGPVKGPDRL